MVSASWFIWLDSPARSNPHDPKSPAFCAATPNQTLTAQAQATLTAQAGGSSTFTGGPPAPPASPSSIPTATFTSTFTPPPPGSTNTDSPTNSPTNSPSPTVSPTNSPSPTASPTATAGAACYAPDHLDLLTTNGDGTVNPCTGPSLQPAFQIYNNGTTPVQITSLQIRGWFNQYAIVGSGWGGEVYRCHVYDNTGTQVDPSGIASTAVMATGTYGSMKNAGDLLVHDEPDNPGGGLCEGRGISAPFFPLNSTDPSGLFDTGCSNYSGVGGATPYNPAF